MRRTVFKSVFNHEINNYLDYKVSSGYSEKSYYYHLKKFDQFCILFEITIPEFTTKHATEWLKRYSDEASTTHYSRINSIKNFLIYLSKKGYDVFVTRDICFKETNFKPYIYSDNEVNKYFNAIDTFDTSRNKKHKIQYPILFRIMYCCGTRINETLGIRKKDVDLEDGIIKLFETKNNCERFIVLGEDLLFLMRQYADKSFYLLNEDDYIFTNANGGRLNGNVIYEHHRLFLQRAEIPFRGNGEGPRIHDWRHRFSIYSFKQMIDSGTDMYVALPILSTYLGHKTIYATERYVRLTMNMFPYIEKRFKDKLEAIFGEVNHENN